MGDPPHLDVAPAAAPGQAPMLKHAYRSDYV
jgi:hypothetical protein